MNINKYKEINHQGRFLLAELWYLSFCYMDNKLNKRKEEKEFKKWNENEPLRGN